MIKTTANKIIIRGDLLSEPSNDDSLFSSICANGIAMRKAINSRGKPGPKIEIIHDSKRLLYASKDGTFERENCFVTPLDGLNGRDASRLRAPWLHYASCILNKFSEFENKNSQGRENSPGSFIVKELFHQEDGLQF